MIYTFFLAILFKVLGGILGYFLPIADAIGYAVYLHPDQPESLPTKTAMDQKQLGAVFQHANELLKQPVRFIHRGIVFFAVFAVLGIFVLTSTDSAIGKGVIAGFGLHLLLAMLPYRRDLAGLKQRFFLGLAPSVSSAAVYTLIVVLVVIVILTALL